MADNDTIICDRIIEVLKRALAADHDAVRALMEHREPCNESLAADPTIQVLVKLSDDSEGEAVDESYGVGLLGILCGISGAHADGFAKIAAIYETECPEHGEVEAMAGEDCPVDGCGREVILGAITDFIRTRVEAPPPKSPSVGLSE